MDTSWVSPTRVPVGTASPTSGSAPWLANPVLQRCQETVEEIDATQRGTSKAWQNVQPCVLRSVRTLSELAHQQHLRLTAVEEKLDDVRQVLDVLVHDRELKEERYRLDRASHDEALTRLEQAMQQLHIGVQEEKESQARFSEEVVLLGLRQVQSEVASVRAELKDALQRTALSTPAVQRPQAKGDEEGPLTKSMIREVRRLREQWERFNESAASHSQPLQTPRSALVSSPRPREHNGVCNDDVRGGREWGGEVLVRSPYAPPPVLRAAPPQIARWYWSGDQGSHFSRAVRREAFHGGASPPIPWDEQRLYDPRTGCWYSNGTCPFSSAFDDSVSGVVPGMREDVNDALMCFSWPRPSTIGVERTGLYKVTASLVRECPSSSLCAGGSRGDLAPSSPRVVAAHGSSSRVPPPVLSLYVNHNLLTHLGQSSTYALLFSSAVSPTRSSPSRRRPSPSSPALQASRMPSGGRVGAREGASAVRVARPCCEPGQVGTNTISDYVFLTEGSTVHIRCHHLSDTKAVYEAFLELEFIV